MRAESGSLRQCESALLESFHQRSLPAYADRWEKRVAETKDKNQTTKVLPMFPFIPSEAHTSG